MAGHSKWANIKHRKGAADAKRGKIFTKYAKLITIAAQSGGDPIMNPSLRAAIDKAKEHNVPNDNITRAIKRGTGELKDGNIIEEVTYEGFGPGGVALIIECLTDNRNRSVASVRNILNKEGGRPGDSGCVAWMFERKGVIQLENNGNKEDLELKVIDAGAEDVAWDDDILQVYVSVDNFEQYKKALPEDIKIISSGLEMVPKTKTTIDTVDNAEKLLKLLDLLNEDEDVSEVWENSDISDIIMAQIKD
jgi:YebC/PmpR family DNA-binding regulatory protein